LSGVALAFNAIARALEAESDRLSLWIPVLFGGGILAYFALSEEPRLLTAAALIMAAAGLILAGRERASASRRRRGARRGLRQRQLHTEMARAPVLARRCAGDSEGSSALRAPRQGKAGSRCG
jgi:hypothetical protein